MTADVINRLSQDNSVTRAIGEGVDVTMGADHDRGYWVLWKGRNYIGARSRRPEPEDVMEVLGPTRLQWPSVAMLNVCLAAAALYQPYWIGAVGALVATAAKRFRPRVATLWDDNLHVVAMSLAVMGVLAGASRV